MINVPCEPVKVKKKVLIKALDELSLRQAKVKRQVENGRKQLEKRAGQ